MWYSHVVYDLQRIIKNDDYFTLNYRKINQPTFFTSSLKLLRIYLSTTKLSREKVHGYKNCVFLLYLAKHVKIGKEK